MSIEAYPKNTWAVVVGIDRYGEGLRALKHQAESACRFAKWLIDHQVPAEHIYLHLSPKPDSIDRKVHLHDATEDEIYKTLTERIRRQTGELLYIYCGAHGMVADDARTLFTADASADHPRGINLNSLLSSMRSTFFSIPRQAVLVDSCATHTFNKSQLSPRSFSHGRKLPDREQFVLFSAAEAQPAQDGLFSEVMLDWLEKPDNLPTAPESVPDLERMAQELRKYFVQLRNGNEEKPYQIPVYFSHKPWNNEESALIGESRLLSLVPEVLALVKRMDQKVRFSTRDWISCYRRIFRDHDENVARPESLDQALYHLARPIGSNRIELILEFVWRLADMFNHEEAKEWVRRQVSFRYLLTDLEDQMLREKSEKDEGPVYLMIEVFKESEDSQNLLTLRRWIYRGGKPVGHASCQYDDTEDGKGRSIFQCDDTEDGLSHAVFSIIEDMEINFDLNDEDEPAIELFVETPWLKFKGDTWMYNYAPLGSKYSLVLRWRERLIPRSQKTRAWRRMAKQIQDRMERFWGPSILWVPDDISDEINLAAQCNGEFKHSFLGFSVKQVNEERNEIGVCLKAALINGIPYAFFPRREAAANFKLSFDKLINRLGIWDEMPNRLAQMRRESIGQKNHTAADVTMIWDDPRRLPPAYIPLNHLPSKNRT